MTAAKTRESDIIIRNYYRYYRSFVLSGVVELHERPGLQWIMPVKGAKGPMLAFSPQLDRLAEELNALIVGIRSGEIPPRWLITPDVPLQETVSLLEQNGFRNLAAEAPEPEPAMLLCKHDFCSHRTGCRTVECRQVRSAEDFRIWVDIVNTALHGWEMIDAQHYYPWVQNEHFRIYLGEAEGVPVSSAATIQTGEEASLEFVSTLQEYRRQGAAAAVCSTALEELFANGVSSVSLSACDGAAPLYEGLGFHRCFENIVMQYEFLK